MAIGSLSPVAIQQFFDANGNPLAGGKLVFYLAGTTTPTPAYADVNLTVPLANPVILDAAGRAPELFLGALTYKQVLQNAAGVTIWTADNIITPAALRSVGTSTSVTGTQHDFPVPQGIVSFIDFRNTANVTIDGFAGGTAGQLLLLRALGTANVDLISAGSSTSQLGNQLYNFANTGPTTLVGSNGTATYLYQEGSWILLNHEQGGWIRMTFATTDFTAEHNAVPDTWTVDVADVSQLDYRLSGTSLLVTMAIVSTTIGGTPTALHFNKLPFQVKATVSGLPMAVLPHGLGYQSGFTGASAGTTVLTMIRTGSVAWPAGANGTDVYAQLTLSVL